MNHVHELQLADLNANLPARIDLFIASASFESRSIHISKALDRKRVVQACIACNANHWNYNQSNFNTLTGIFQESGSLVAEIRLNSDQPVATVDALILALQKIPTQPKTCIVIDITTFTRESLAILLMVLRRIVIKPATITLLYNPAKSYGDTIKPWLSKGIRQVRSVLGYSGLIVPSRQNHLIVLPGHELERASNLIASYEPNYLSVGIVPKSESYAEEFYSQQIDFVRQLKSSYSSKTLDTFEFSARDPFTTCKQIIGCLEKFPHSNKIVIPLNSKPSVIGACLACFQRSDVQLGYAQPEMYNVTKYSEPSEQVCLFSLRLD